MSTTREEAEDGVLLAMYAGEEVEALLRLIAVGYEKSDPCDVKYGDLEYALRGVSRLLRNVSEGTGLADQYLRETRRAETPSAPAKAPLKAVRR